MISLIDLCDLRDALDKRLGLSLGLSNGTINSCRRAATDLAGGISGYAEEAAALFFVLCRKGPFEDFAIVAAKRILSVNSVELSASDATELFFLAEEVSSSGKEYDEVLNWFESPCRPRRRSRY